MKERDLSSALVNERDCESASVNETHFAIETVSETATEYRFALLKGAGFESALV